MASPPSQSDSSTEAFDVHSILCSDSSHGNLPMQVQVIARTHCRLPKVMATRETSLGSENYTFHSEKLLSQALDHLHLEAKKMFQGHCLEEASNMIKSGAIGEAKSFLKSKGLDYRMWQNAMINGRKAALAKEYHGKDEQVGGAKDADSGGKTASIKEAIGKDDQTGGTDDADSGGKTSGEQDADDEPWVVLSEVPGAKDVMVITGGLQ